MVHMYIPILHMYCGINMGIPLLENPASVRDHGSWYYFPEGWCIAFCSVLTACLSFVPVLHSTQNLLWIQNDFLKTWTALQHSLLSKCSRITNNSLFWDHSLTRKLHLLGELMCMTNETHTVSTGYLYIYKILQLLRSKRYKCISA